MNVKAPKWALALCIVWPFSMFLLSILPILNGSPVDHSTVEIVGPAWAMLMLAILLKFERWSFGLFAVGICAWMVFEAPMLQFGGVSIFQPLFDLVGLAGAVRCYFSPRVAQNQDAVHMAVSRKVMYVCLVVDALAASLFFLESYRCPSDPSMAIASPDDFAGTWVGIATKGPRSLYRTRIEIAPDGTGSLAYGIMLEKPGGFPMQWLLRGHCMHYAFMMTDVWAEGKACPQISADGQTLRFSPAGPRGIAEFHRQ